MAVVAGLLAGTLNKSASGRITCGVVAESTMILGYWLYDGFLLGSLLGATPSILANLMQGSFGLVASTALVSALGAVPMVRRAFPHLV